MKKSVRVAKGFTIIELLIVIAIIGILAAVAVPTYLTYTAKAYFSEVVQATGPYRLGVDNCYQSTGSLAACNAGANGIPAAMTGVAAQNVASVTVAAGVITATGQNNANLNGTAYTFILTPTASSVNGALTWAKGGTCAAQGLC